MPRKLKKHLPPRRKRMTRHGRLASAKATRWVEKYEGKNLIKGYANWFAVDLLCAVAELRMLGVEISEEREKQLRGTAEARAAEKNRLKEAAAQAEIENFYTDCDDTFAYIAGHTSGVSREFHLDKCIHKIHIQKY
jgi:hypothetical protein